MMGTVYSVLRVLDVVMYLSIVSGLIMHWRVLSRVEPELPQFRWAVTFLVAAGAYGVAEVVWISLPGGPRVWFVSAALVLVFRSCYWNATRRVWRRWRTRGRDYRATQRTHVS